MPRPFELPERDDMEQPLGFQKRPTAGLQRDFGVPSAQRRTHDVILIEATAIVYDSSEAV